jgi:3-methyladenine DNA glycosylase AlkD
MAEMKIKSPAGDAIRAELKAVADPEKAELLLRFFKTGPGEYGAGDQFLGIVMPKVRKIVRSHRQASNEDILSLLHSKYHEERMTALLILVEQYRRSDAARRNAIYHLYLENTAWINNWDLVDLTAPHIVGAQLHKKDKTILKKLALSKNLWERRIAALSTFYFISHGECRDALGIAGLLLHDPHDLIHKAVGWMLREVGKRCSMEQECAFLDSHSATMPRTMLRYAIERFPEPLRLKYLKAGVRSQESEVRRTADLSQLLTPDS